MKILKRIWWIFIIIAIIIIVFLDRTYKYSTQYEYDSYIQENNQQIQLVDSLSIKARENHKQVNVIKQTYRNKRDSLEQLKLISGHDKNRISELNKMIEKLDKENETARSERIKIFHNQIFTIDSLKCEIEQKDKEIELLKAKNDLYIKQLNDLKELLDNIKEEKEKSMEDESSNGLSEEPIDSIEFSSKKKKKIIGLF